MARKIQLVKYLIHLQIFYKLNIFSILQKKHKIIQFSCWDKDPIGQDFMGEVEIPLNTLEFNGLTISIFLQILNWKKN